MTIIQFPTRGRFLKAKKSDSLPQKTGRNIKTYLEVRDREYLFEEEVKAMIQVAFNLLRKKIRPVCVMYELVLGLQEMMARKSVWSFAGWELKAYCRQVSTH